jgi:propanol-preferring alcohol dehydrogenase
MKAMVLERVGPAESAPLRLVDLPTPSPGVEEVRVRVSCCAICRTDLHVIEGDLPAVRLPVIPGHQAVGVVDALGPGCRRLRVGDRVGIAWLRSTCGTCEYCTTGRENLCEASAYTGWHADGGYAEFAIAPEAFVHGIPATFDDRSAAPLLCAGIIGYRALARSRLPAGGRLAIFGFGSSAHVVMQLARHRGCEVYVVSRGEGHLRLARRMGAAWAGHDAADMPVRVDSAILFAPAGELVPVGLACLKKGGTLALAGIHMSAIPSMDYQRSVFYERDIHSVTSNTREDARALLAEAAAIPVRPEVTEYPLADANRALQDLKADRINGTGVLEMPAGS